MMASTNRSLGSQPDYYPPHYCSSAPVFYEGACGQKRLVKKENNSYENCKEKNLTGSDS
jgi:hypothetical protein